MSLVHTFAPLGVDDRFITSSIPVDSEAAGAARLRHAFIQAKLWTVGQTWSTFSDPQAEPIGIEFEGLNAISLFRQPQIRFTQPFRANPSASFAVENPAPDLTGAQGVSYTPDFVARLRWEPRKGVPGPNLLGRAAHVRWWPGRRLRSARRQPAGAARLFRILRV